MNSPLDRLHNRRGTESTKWSAYPEDVLPLSGAEMDFAAPEAVIRALYERLDHPLFGYNAEPAGLREAVLAHLDRRYGWRVPAEALLFFPSVITGVNLACRSLAAPGDGALLQPPIYDGLLTAPANSGLLAQMAPLAQDPAGAYRMSLTDLARAASQRTRLFVLCNPHNPVGRVFRREELEEVAGFCMRHDLLILSDEIYGDWVYPGHRHVPIASLSREIGRRAITFYGTSKSHNIPGLRCAVAVVENPELRARLDAAAKGLIARPNTLAFLAARAAFAQGQDWQASVLQYLEANRDLVCDYVRDHLPGVRVAKPEGTPVAWLDCRAIGLGESQFEFFLREARVELRPGEEYGPTGEGFARLAFGCPRTLLLEGLDRMRRALESR